ncbi:MAG: hypothetical protein GX410_06435 [Elusimicrobia bacterium]|nr:hypothetical protein [Elusimicrobiota bacterium]
MAHYRVFIFSMLTCAALLASEGFCRAAAHPEQPQEASPRQSETPEQPRRLLTADGELSFLLPGPDWSMQSSTAATVFQRPDGSIVLLRQTHKLFPQHKNAKSVPILFKNALCRQSRCDISPIPERFATTSGPDVFRASISGDGGPERKVYLVQLDTVYFAVEQAGVPERDLLALLSSAIHEQASQPEPDSSPKLYAEPLRMPLPQRLESGKLLATPQELSTFSWWILAAQAAALLALAMLGLRLMIPDRQAPPREAETDSPYPVRITKNYVLVHDAFNISDAQGNLYRITSNDPALLLKAGLLLFAAAKITAAAAAGVSGVSPEMNAFLAALPGYALILALSGILTAMTYKRSFSMKSVRAGAEILTITPGLSPSGRRVFHVYDSTDKLISVIEQETRILSLARRRWRLKDTAGNTHIEMIEDNDKPALARKLFGHCWGLLRSSYLIQERYGAMGEMRPDSISQSYTIYMSFSATDHRVVAAMAAVIYLVTPDRWHPWFT